MKRSYLCAIAILILSAILVSCQPSLANSPEDVCGLYARPNANGFDAFTITLNPDGTYQYFETMISSHLGFGSYTVEDGIVTLVDSQIPGVNGSLTHTYQFKYADGKLIFLAEESDSFMYINLPDGAEFEPREIHTERE